MREISKYLIGYELIDICTYKQQYACFLFYNGIYKNIERALKNRTKHLFCIAMNTFRKLCPEFFSCRKDK